MAIFYGKESAYLWGGDVRNFGWGLAVIVFLFAGFVYLLSKLPPLGIVAVGLMIIIILVFAIEPIMRKIVRNSGKFYKGRWGEKDIKRELGKLPDTYHVFQGVTIGHNKGDIDFVVLGPNGIFPIEVKSHRGDIGYDGLELTLNGKQFFDKNILRQCHGQVWALKNFLLQKGCGDIFIRPILVFSNAETRIHTNSQPVANVYVVQKDFLVRLIQNLPVLHTSSPIRTIASILSSAVA